MWNFLRRFAVFNLVCDLLDGKGKSRELQNEALNRVEDDTVDLMLLNSLHSKNNIRPNDFKPDFYSTHIEEEFDDYDTFIDEDF